MMDGIVGALTMKTPLALAAITVLTLSAAPAPAQKAAPLVGYLGAAAIDTTPILPPAPVAGATRYEADRTVFLATRSMKDTPQWSLATQDADQPTVIREMRCALGVDLTAGATPKTQLLLRRVEKDARVMTDPPKAAFKRQRPYLIDEGPTCVEKTASLAASPDYPSGHNTYAWAVGLIVAELAPDQAVAILRRARVFGEGRLVCGVHNLSAVEAGRLNASIMVSALHGQKAFRDDMDAARKELAAARKVGPAPDAALCATQAQTMEKSPY